MKIIKKIGNFFFSTKQIKKNIETKFYVAILILLLDLILMGFGINLLIQRDIRSFGEKNEYIGDLYQINDGNELFDDIKANDFKIEDKKLLSINKELKYFAYNHQEKNYRITLLFDPNNLLENELRNIEEYIKNNHSDIHKNIIGHISLLTYIEKEDPVEKTINNLKTLSLEELVSKLNKYSYFDIYGIDKTNNKDILIIFNQDNIQLQLEHNDEIVGNTFSYTDDFSFNNFMDFKTLFSSILDIVAENLLQAYGDNYIFTVLLIYATLPLLIALLSYLLLKHNRILLTYQEYYKLASLLTIFPTIISLLIGLYVKENAIFGFIGLYIAYYFLMIVLINTKQKGSKI